MLLMKGKCCVIYDSFVWLLMGHFTAGCVKRHRTHVYHNHCSYINLFSICTFYSKDVTGNVYLDALCSVLQTIPYMYRSKTSYQTKTKNKSIPKGLFFIEGNSRYPESISISMDNNSNTPIL